jgi:hypothetical protein
MHMLLEGAPRVSRILCYGIGLVCLCVVMYMLGSTMTLWTMEFALDQTDSPLLEGFSLPTIFSGVIPAVPVRLGRESSAVPLRQLSGNALLRPPITTS